MNTDYREAGGATYPAAGYTSTAYPGAGYAVAAHPVVRILASFPIACFCCALVTDLAYAQTALMIWADFSAWLLAVGLVMGVLAFIAGLIDLVAQRRRPGRSPRGAAALVIGGLIVLALALFNNLVHSRDAWTSVVPWGLALSAVTVVVMLATVWLGTERAMRIRPARVPAGVRS